MKRASIPVLAVERDRPAPTIVGTIEQWSVDRPIINRQNARTHSARQIAAIASAIAEFGFVNPILAGPDDIIIAGHARLAAARKLGLSHVPVIVLHHLSETQKRALALADNRLALDAGWDEALLRQELSVLQEQNFALDLTGFRNDELQRLLETEVAAALTDEDAIPSLTETPITIAGDIWIAEPHRVMCGDTTQRGDVERLMAGESADLIFSDPPYNVKYQGYTEDHLTMSGDCMSAEQFQQFLETTFSNLRLMMKSEASLYICHASSWQREVQTALEQSGFSIRCQLIWAKSTFAWGFGRYKYQHEPLFYCHLRDVKDRWFGDKSQSTLWQENKPFANRGHPCSKPVELVERALLNSSRVGDLIADPFGGSGSTLIACERRGRRALLMEIDPRYVDVILRRWEEFTGKQAILEGDGRSYAEITDVRCRSTDRGDLPASSDSGMDANGEAAQ